MKNNQLPLESFILKKMEDKLNEIQQNRQLLMNINSIDDFKVNRNKIIQAMFDMEDDIRESYQLVKSAFMQNKDLVEQIEFEESKSAEFLERVNNQEKVINGMKIDYINVYKELQIKNEKEKADEEYIRELEEKVLQFEKKGMTSENVVKNKYEFDSGVNLKGKNREEYAVPNLNFKYEKENDWNDKKFTINNNKNMSTIVTTNNYSDILTERENNKKMLNDYVNDHLNLNFSNLNKSVNNKSIEREREVYDKNSEKNNDKKNSINFDNKSNLDVSPLRRTPISSTNKINGVQATSDSPSQNAKNTKLKANRIMEILKKFNSNSDINSIINKLFGENILNQLMSSTVDEDLIDRVEQTIIEIEKLREKDLEEDQVEENKYNQYEYQNYPNNNQNILKQDIYNYNRNTPDYKYYKNDNVNQVIEEKDEAEEDRQINFNNLKKEKDYLNKSYEKGNVSYDILAANNLRRPKKSGTIQRVLNKSPSGGKVRNFEEGNFENSLRRYIGGADHKVFKHYTKPYGNFFDPSLQKGGISKISQENSKKNNRSKSKQKYNPQVYPEGNFSYISSPSKSFTDKGSYSQASQTNYANNMRQYQFSD